MKIAVIGAGLTGLTAGMRLSSKGHEVTIFEEADKAGGLASAFTAGKESLDSFYHHIFVSDTEILDLITELDLKDKLNWYTPKNAIYLEDQLFPFTTPLDLLLFKPLHLISRIRMGLTVLASAFINDYKPFEAVTAKEWIIGRSGSESYEKIWGPLLKSKFDKDADHISGTWIWNKFKLRGSSRGKNISKEQLGYLDGGFITLLDAMAKMIENNRGSINTKSRVLNIKKSDSEDLWEVTTGRGTEAFDKVLFTGAPNALSGILKDSPEQYNEALQAINYKANLCLALELESGLSPYYWITIAQDGLPFVLIIEHTNLVGMRGYGSHVVYLSRYLDPSNPLYSASEDEIKTQFIAGLHKVFPHFHENTIKHATLSRAAYAQPVVTKDYSDRIPYIRTPLKGLYLASMPQIYPEDRGLNYAVRLGNQAVKNMMDDL